MTETIELHVLHEAKLIEAIKNGCPFCGSDDLCVTSDELTSYRVRVADIILPNGSTSKPEEEIDWYDSNCIESNDKVFYCSECNQTLWRWDSGWIPELKEVVK